MPDKKGFANLLTDKLGAYVEYTKYLIEEEGENSESVNRLHRMEIFETG